MPIQNRSLQPQFALQEMPGRLRLSCSPDRALRIEAKAPGLMAALLGVARLEAMTQGIITKIVRTHGSRWGKVRSTVGSVDSFFNEASMAEGEEFEGLSEGDAVEYEEEADRVNGARAVRLILAQHPPSSDGSGEARSETDVETRQEQRHPALPEARGVGAEQGYQ